MYQDSPGSSSIEMIDMDELSPPRSGQIKYPLLPAAEPVDLEEEDVSNDQDEDDEGNAALLTGSSQRTRFEVSPSKVWPQVRSIVIESAPTLLMTTVSLLFTGKLLDTVSHWRAMQEVDQLIIIVPVVLNLNGNLEMNLSARLSTAANVGELEDPAVLRSVILGSLALLQVQTISVSFIAACIALILGRFVPKTNIPAAAAANATSQAVREFLLDSREHAVRQNGITTFIMVAATTMASAALSGLVLGSFMCALVVLCRKFDRDPDNIAPAIASCLGDLVTLILLGAVSTLLIPFVHSPIPLILGFCIIVFAACCLFYTLRNPHIRPLLTQGWSPLFGAMAISSGTGIVLDTFVSRYEGFAVLAIVISGLPGAAGSILVSRLSTSLHAAKLALEHALPSYSSSSKHQEPSALLSMLTLLVITLPVELLFLTVLNLFGWLKLPLVFVMFSVLFFCCAVLSSLIIARLLTAVLWSLNRDPDLYALPIHSALMDLIGQLLLVLCFEIVSKLGAAPRGKG